LWFVLYDLLLVVWALDSEFCAPFLETAFILDTNKVVPLFFLLGYNAASSMTKL
jgi:hypothetical protein